MCEHIQLSYTTQHRTVLIIFPLILQIITEAQLMSTGGKGASVVKTHQYLKTEMMKRRSKSPTKYIFIKYNAMDALPCNGRPPRLSYFIPASESEIWILFRYPISNLHCTWVVFAF